MITIPNKRVTTLFGFFKYLIKIPYKREITLTCFIK